MIRADPTTLPSWNLPITVGAILAFFTQILVGTAMQHPVLWCVASCACCGGVIPLGWLPAFLAKKRDPWLASSQGFVIAFIAVGLGSLAAAAIQVFAPIKVPAPQGQDADWREALRKAFTEAQRDGAADLDPAEFERALDAVEKLLPYVPVVVAAVLTVISAFVGMVTVALMRAPQPPPQPPPTSAQ